MTLRVGRYETLRAVASGGMATVYLGRALGAGGFERLVAIKVMHPHIADDPEFVAMFLDEARLAARVRHPNVVATIDVQQADMSEGGTEGGPRPLVLVMEYIEGPSLQTILRELRKERGAVPLGIAVRIFLDLLAGLHAAHELTGPDGVSLQLIHRDVSPQNVLVGTDGISRITDFGVARAETRLSSTRGGQLKGKIAFMSPEQIRTESTDRRCDIYAAGAVLWETLVGQRLFRAENDGAMVSKILAGATQSPRDLNLGIPAELDEVCMRALRVDPGERYATAADFAEALEDAAIAARIPIATPRAVSAFVRGLAVHEPASHDGSGTPASNPVYASQLAGAPTSSTPPPPAGSSPSKRNPPRAPGEASGSSGAGAVGGVTGSTHVGAVVSFAPPRRARRRGLILVALVAIAGAGGALFFAGRLTIDGAPGAAAPQLSPPVAAPSASASAAAAADSPVAAATTAPSSAPEPSSTTAVTPGAPTRASAPVTPVTMSAPVALPQAPRLPPRAAPSSAAKPPASPTSFRPSDL